MRSLNGQLNARPSKNSKIHGLPTYPRKAYNGQAFIFILYLSSSTLAVSAILVKEGVNKQLPMYYVSKFFALAAKKHIDIEKYLYMLIIASQKLCPFFHAHEIVILIEKQLKHFYNS